LPGGEFLPSPLRALVMFLFLVITYTILGAVPDYLALYKTRLLLRVLSHATRSSAIIGMIFIDILTFP